MSAWTALKVEPARSPETLITASCPRTPQSCLRFVLHLVSTKTADGNEVPNLTNCNKGFPMRMLVVADQGAGDQQTPSGRAAVSVQGAGPTAASSAVASAANTASGVGGPRECAGCGKRITERYLLKVKCLPAQTSRALTCKMRWD